MDREVCQWDPQNADEWTIYTHVCHKRNCGLGSQLSRSDPHVLRALILFFFQAEDGIRDRDVTGVQTCALPIFASQRTRSSCSATTTRSSGSQPRSAAARSTYPTPHRASSRCSLHAPLRVCPREIGRASCRERGQKSGVRGSVNRPITILSTCHW